MSSTRLQKWLSSHQNFSDQYETEAHEEDMNCLGISSDILEDSFKSLCVQCKRNHLKNTISQLYTDIIKDIYKLALSILLSGHFIKSGNKAYLRIRKGPLSKVLFMIKYIKDKESFENIFAFVQNKLTILMDRTTEVFTQYKNAEKSCQILLMHETFVLISRISKILQPVTSTFDKNLKKIHQELFYDKVMKGRSDLYKHLNFVPTPDAIEKKLLKKFNKFRDPELLEEIENYSVHTHCCSQCDPELLLEELQTSSLETDKESLDKKGMSIDQIVEFIEGKGEGRGKRGKRRKRKNKDEVSEELKEIDGEVEEFSRRLDCCLALVRPKPCCSSGFIEELKARIRVIKDSYV